MGSEFNILDAAGQPAFWIKGKAFSWGDKLSFQSIEGEELAFISQKLWSMMPRYEIYREGSLFAEVVKEFTWFNKSFTLDVPGPNDYSITGDFWDHHYTFMRSGQEVARVEKKFFSATDTYGVEIADGEDVVSILATCIVIDQVLADDD